MSSRARSRSLPSRSTSWRDLLFFPIGFSKLDAAAFLNVVPGVHRQLADDVPLDDSLAAEPRLGRQVPCSVQTIRLVVFHVAEVLRALTDDDVARRARAAAVACVLERDVQVLGHVEKRLRL